MEGILKIAEIIQCHDIFSPLIFYTQRCGAVRKETEAVVKEIATIAIDEQKRAEFINLIGEVFSDYYKETAKMDNQARYNQGKLAFDAVSMLFGAGEIKTAVKSGRLIKVISTNLKKNKAKGYCEKIKATAKENYKNTHFCYWKTW